MACARQALHQLGDRRQVLVAERAAIDQVETVLQVPCGLAISAHNERVLSGEAQVADALGGESRSPGPHVMERKLRGMALGFGSEALLQPVGDESVQLAAAPGPDFLVEGSLQEWMGEIVDDVGPFLDLGDDGGASQLLGTREKGGGIHEARVAQQVMRNA